MTFEPNQFSPHVNELLEKARRQIPDATIALALLIKSHPEDEHLVNLARRGLDGLIAFVEVIEELSK